MGPTWRSGSTALLAAGLVALLGATLTLYVHHRVLDADSFADSAVSTLDDPAVERYVSTQITERVIDRIDPDLVSFKPLVESAVASLLDTEALRRALRRGVLVAHGAVFDRDLDSAAVAVGNVGALIVPALERVDPQLAGQVPRGLDAQIADFADQPVLVDAAQAASTVDRLAGLLPALAIILIGGSVLIAQSRRRAAIAAGLAIVALATVSFVALKVGRAALLDRVDGSERDAAAAAWDAYLGDLLTWELAIAAIGVVIATAAASVLRSFDLHEPLRRAWRLAVDEPAGGRRLFLWALALICTGALMVLAPERLLTAAVVVAGVYLIARAVSALVGSLARARGWAEATCAAESADPIDARRVLIAGAAVVALLAAIVGVGLSALLRADRSAPAAAAAPFGLCNGARALCDRSLERVAFLATHNCYAGSGYPGFLFPEQEGDDLHAARNGVRGLWIDTYYGVPGRRVYTLTDLIDPALNAQLKAELGPEFEPAAANLRSRIAEPPADAPRRIYLCHGFCELGAVEAGDEFRAIARFLEENPREVLIIDLEDYTGPATR